jgi:hypothetical protein
VDTRLLWGYCPVSYRSIGELTVRGSPRQIHIGNEALDYGETDPNDDPSSCPRVYQWIEVSGRSRWVIYDADGAHPQR